MKLNHILTVTLFLSSTYSKLYASNFLRGSCPVTSKIADLDDAMKLMKNLGQPRPLCGFWFKGIGLPRRELQPSIFFQPYKENIIRKRANTYGKLLRNIAAPNAFNLMAYMQYCDEPSILIDWEDDFLRALFDSVFLAEDEKSEFYEKDAKTKTKFFVLDPYKLNKISKLPERKNVDIYHSNDLEVDIRALSAQYNNEKELAKFFLNPEKVVTKEEMLNLLIYFHTSLPVAVYPRLYAAPKEKHTHKFTIHGGWVGAREKILRPMSLEVLNSVQNDEDKFLKVYSVENRLKIKRQLSAIGIHEVSVRGRFDLWHDEVWKENARFHKSYFNIL